MKNFVTFITDGIKKRNEFSFPTGLLIFIDKEIAPNLDGALRKELKKSRICLGEIRIDDINVLLKENCGERYDVIIVGDAQDEEGSLRRNLGSLVNRCAFESSYVFISRLGNRENVIRELPETLKGLFKLECDNEKKFVSIIPEQLFISKMAAYAYFEESPYKELIPCVVPYEKLDSMIFCPEADKIAGKKMVVGIVKENLTEQERSGFYFDKDLNFCVIGVPHNNGGYDNKLNQQFDVGRCIKFSADKKVSELGRWGNNRLLPDKLWNYLRVLLPHSAKAILEILKISKAEKTDHAASILSRKIGGKQFSLYSITVGQYIPTQRGCCTFACYYIDDVNSGWEKIHKIATALYAQLSSFVLSDARRRFLGASMKSAIGSIMSRNGSHNIGSHVLADLSHNVGTMPDDRVLYQYIQHRMDYIATATTEFPIWSQPLPLVGNVVKNFLIQRHLLDHITGSEGLHAYQFQNDKVPTLCDGKNANDNSECQPATIRIHARRIRDGVEWNESTYFKVRKDDIVDFIPYPTGEYVEDVSKMSLLRDDVEVAIPGGVVGRHAFYTILENVLRNAAKHEWSRMDDGRRKSACLDVFVDFKDNPSQGVVETVVWTDCEYSAQNYDINKFKNPDGLTSEKIKIRLASESGKKSLELSDLPEHRKLQVKIARSFIADDGQLRKENWGLAEMRISAGYLNVADIADIGGISDSDLRFELIKPVMVLNGTHYCLGYHFDIPKPKELLIVVPQFADVDEKVVHKAHEVLMQYGVGVMGEKEVLAESCKKEKSSKLSYAYVLLNAFKKKEGCPGDGVDASDMRTWKLPFRVVTNDEARLEPPGNKKVDRRAKYYASTEEKNVFVSIGEKLRAVAKSKDYAKSFAMTVLSDIYRSWVRHLKKESLNDEQARIVLAIDVNRESANNKGGKDLVSDADLLKILFEVCFDKAVDSFMQMWGGNRGTCSHGKDIDGRLMTTLEKMKKMCPRVVGIEPSRILKRKDDQGKEIEETIVFTVVQMLRQQLIKWCASIYAGSDVDIQKDVKESVKVVWNDLYAVNTSAKAKSDLVGMDAFLEYLRSSILPQARVFLSMYEECFATLPKAITVAKEISNDTDVSALDNQKIEATTTEKDKKELLKSDARVIAYWRHENYEEKRECLYLEPLSGAQSYLAAFECLATDDIDRTRFVVKLVENGFLRILLIDERVKKFVETHSDVKETFRHIGIVALDDTSPEVEAIFKNKTGCLEAKVGCPGLEIANYDIVIIHQGIIDKKLEACETVKMFIERLKNKVRYVVVTTGRGSPANIPPDVRILPFSVVESTLFKKYPEKMILVDAVMNILPTYRREDT